MFIPDPGTSDADPLFVSKLIHDRFPETQVSRKNNDGATSNKRIGSWISTYTGKRFYPLDPRPDEIDISDILHALSNQTRFAGHCSNFYSVAQHSVLVSSMCSKENALWGLLHDASEAYLIDIPSPLKKSDAFKPYVTAEKKLMDVICDVYGLSHQMPAEVHEVDKKIFATEARDMTISQGRGWTLSHEPYEFHIKPWSPEIARVKFLSKLHELIQIKAK